MAPNAAPSRPAGSYQRIAIVGGGVAGIMAAHLLSKKAAVTLFEAEPSLGGHTYTVEVDAQTRVDMGFIVCNERNYPYFYAFLDELGVARQSTDMSFSYHDPASGFCYAGSKPSQLFAQRRNLFNLGHWAMLWDILRLGRAAEADLAMDAFAGQTLGEWLTRRGFTGSVKERYLLPMAAAIWSASMEDVEAFPMAAFARFFHNHGLLSLRDRPRWAFIPGGSQTYVRAFVKQFTGAIRAGEPVNRIRRTSDGVRVHTAKGEADFDALVLACHADQALAMLADADEAERQRLGPWRYAENTAVLHTDTAVLPPERRAWACWNYRHENTRPANSPVSVHYHMNQLQQLNTTAQYIVSLNPVTPVAPEHVVHVKTFTHPQYTFAAMDTQSALEALQGRRRTYYCGSYHGYGFHEDAVRSAHVVAARMGTL